MNTFGTMFCLSSFGESHGMAIGGIIDGMPAGLRIDLDFIQNELDKRRPGRNKFATARNEADKIEIFSGVFEGVSTGTPIGFAIFNSNQKSGDYENLRHLFRPGHADFGYYKKYGIRDYRGGGRSSARETAVRVAGGAFAQLFLNEFGISVQSGVLSVGGVEASNELDWDLADRSEIFALCNEEKLKEQILLARQSHDSIGSCILTKATGVMPGLGEVLYNRLDATLSSALMGINGVKAVEIGAGVMVSSMLGSQNNDQYDNGWLSNNAGGILGGISSGQDILLKSHFKPTPSIFKSQKTFDLDKNNVEFELRGRHDPCIGIRGSVVANAMTRLVLADMILLNLSSNLATIKRAYGK